VGPAGEVSARVVPPTPCIPSGEGQVKGASGKPEKAGPITTGQAAPSEPEDGAVPADDSYLP
jgi:hypothetical protein